MTPFNRRHFNQRILMPSRVKLPPSHSGFHRGIFYCVKREENSDRWHYSFSVSEQGRVGTINTSLGLLAARRVRHSYRQGAQERGKTVVRYEPYRNGPNPAKLPLS